jgi:GNAT superfamily N-acetyltransferase
LAARVTYTDRDQLRWQQIDPLLPVPEPLSPGCGAGPLTAEPDGPLRALGTCEHWQGAPGSLGLAWGTAARFTLAAQIVGPDVPGQLDQVLSQWQEHLADVPGSGSQDTAAVITWPSRDVAGVPVLLRRGFAPMAVIAARTMSRDQARPGNPSVHGLATQPAGERLLIRRAGPDDLDEVVRMGLEVIRYDAHFGLIERPDTPGALRREAEQMLARPGAWVWLAELDGLPAGMLAAERPGQAAWIAPMVNLSPVAYLLLTYVLPGQRRAGIGAALAAELHREAQAAGIAVTLLHYAPANPLSAPFWSQQGYRPLWTVWETRPANAIR